MHDLASMSGVWSLESRPKFWQNGTHAEMEQKRDGAEPGSSLETKKVSAKKWPAS